MRNCLRFGALLAVAIAGISISGCGADEKCPAGCPATYMSVFFDIMSSADGGVVSDVEVAFSGPSEGSMKCETTDAGTDCFWPGGPVSEGTYLLQVSASGYKPAKIDAKMTIMPDPQCGCAGAALKPSEVTLDPL
jgi:hypothetical protein